MLSHGIVSAALFLCVGVVYDRMHTREIAAYGGLVNRMPLYAVCFMVFTLANVGLPGTSGFVGEFLTLLGAFKANTWVAFFATTGVILSAAYALWLYRRVIFGALDKPALQDASPTLSYREIAGAGAAGDARPSCSASIRRRCSTSRRVVGRRRWSTRLRGGRWRRLHAAAPTCGRQRTMTMASTDLSYRPLRRRSSWRSAPWRC